MESPRFSEIPLHVYETVSKFEEKMKNLVNLWSPLSAQHRFILIPVRKGAFPSATTFSVACDCKPTPLSQPLLDHSVQVSQAIIANIHISRHVCLVLL